MKFLAKISAVVGVALCAGTAMAQDAHPEYVKVRSISYAGSGCPAGSVAQNIAPDAKAFTLLFDQYVAEVGPGVPLTASRKNCAVAVDLDFPNGWSYSILDVDYRGFYELEAGVTAEQKSSYYFQGDAKTAALTTTVRGPITKDYHIRDSLGLEALVWSPCHLSRALNINTQVRAAAASRFARGLITLDSIDGTLTHVYGLRWRRC
jgi:hypothetical protein